RLLLVLESARLNNVLRHVVLEHSETGNANTLDHKIDTLCIAASAVVNRAAFNDDIEILRASGNCDCPSYQSDEKQSGHHPAIEKSVERNVDLKLFFGFLE